MPITYQYEPNPAIQAAQAFRTGARQGSAELQRWMAQLQLQYDQMSQERLLSQQRMQYGAAQQQADTAARFGLANLDFERQGALLGQQQQFRLQQQEQDQLHEQQMQEQDAELRLQNSLKQYEGKLDADGQQMIRDIKMRVKHIKEFAAAGNLTPEQEQMAIQAVAADMTGKQGLLELFQTTGDGAEKYMTKVGGALTRYLPPGARTPQFFIDPEATPEQIKAYAESRTIPMGVSPDGESTVGLIQPDGSITIAKTAGSGAKPMSRVAHPAMLPPDQYKAFSDSVQDLLKATTGEVTDPTTMTSKKVQLLTPDEAFLIRRVQARMYTEAEAESLGIQYEQINQRLKQQMGADPMAPAVGAGTTAPGAPGAGSPIARSRAEAAIGQRYYDEEGNIALRSS